MKTKFESGASMINSLSGLNFSRTMYGAKSLLYTLPKRTPYFQPALFSFLLEQGMDIIWTWLNEHEVRSFGSSSTASDVVFQKFEVTDMVSIIAFGSGEGITGVRYDRLNQRLAVSGIQGSLTIFEVGSDGKTILIFRGV